MKGKVFLIGAGPGDPELMTVKAVNRLKSADVVIYDRLVSPEIMALAPEGAELIDVGKQPKCHRVPQEEINEILASLAMQGRNVVRLKGGDPLIFGRGSEEGEHLAAAGIEFEYIPGITSAQGASSSLGFPLTHRDLATGVRLVTGHRARDAKLDLDWESLANEDTTLVIYMGSMNIAEISFNLIRQGMPPSLPAMAVASATTPREKKIVCTLGTIATELAAGDLKAPILIIIGHVVSLCPDSALRLAGSNRVAANNS